MYPDSNQTGTTHVFRVRKAHKRIGLFATPFFVVLACLTAAGPSVNRWMGRETGDVRALYFVGVIWLFFVLLGIYYVAACFRYRITWTDRSFEIQELFRTRRFNIDEIREMIWPLRSDSVKLEGPFGTVKIQFPLFFPNEVVRLQSLLHNSVPLEKQRNWEHFFGDTSAG